MDVRIGSSLLVCKRVQVNDWNRLHAKLTRRDEPPVAFNDFRLSIRVSPYPDWVVESELPNGFLYLLHLLGGVNLRVTRVLA